MTKEQYIKAAYQMLYLAGCGLREEKPDPAKIARMDLDILYEVCQSHSLTALVAYALESAGTTHHEFNQAKEKAIRKVILHDMERKRICAALEEAQIWHIPLKGALLCAMYPRIGMRQISDNDILCDPQKRDTIREIMCSMGYTCEHFGVDHDDAYFKPPVCNFEMHWRLFTLNDAKGLYEYYTHIQNHLVRDQDSRYGFHFTAEDFYIYMIAHEYKHYAAGGTGVRSLADTYVFLKKNPLDWHYVRTELEKIGITEFEEENRTLAEAVFQKRRITGRQKQILEYYILSGTYGIEENQMRNRIRQSDSIGQYILKRLFPSAEVVGIWHPYVLEHRYLLPFYWLMRPVRAITVRRRKTLREFRVLLKNLTG